MTTGTATYGNPQGQSKPLVLRLAPKEGWLTFGLLAVVLVAVVRSVEEAQWVPNMPSLAVPVMLGALLALGLAKLRFSGLVLMPLGLLVGFALVSFQASLTIEEGNWQERLGELFQRLDLFIKAARSGDISVDILPFTFILLLAGWLVGYVSAWFIFRSQSVWAGTIPSGFAILTNLSYLPEQYASWFILYLLGAMLLVMRLHVVNKKKEWDAYQVQYPRWLGAAFFNEAFWVSAAVLLVAWQLPTTAFTIEPLKETWIKLRAPMQQFEYEMGRLFSGLPSRKPIPLHNYGRSLPFRGNISPGTELALQVEATSGGYWRAKVYDAYTSKGWVASEPEVHPLGWEPKDIPRREYSKRREIAQKIDAYVPTQHLFALGQLKNANIEASLLVLPPLTFVIDLEDLSKNSALPSDLEALAAGLAGSSLQPSAASEAFIKERLPSQTRLDKVSSSFGRVNKITVSRTPPNPPDLVGVVARGGIKASRTYEVVSSRSGASSDDLRAAGARYPKWVTDRYLALPSTLPERVRALARDIARNSPTPYDKALALQEFLRQYPYTLEVEAPAFDADGVDHFLFNLRKGYSDYYSAAMTVMLRAVGIPARLTVGYTQGERRNTGVYLVRENNAHAWPEAFFPGYGWVEFEPSPIFSPIGRGEGLPGEEESLTEELEQDTQPFFDEFLEDDMFFGGGTISLGTQIGNFTRPLGFALLGLMVAVLLAILAWRLSFITIAPSLRPYVGMLRLASFAGKGLRPHQTPLEYGGTLSEALPPHATEIRDITEGYVKLRYGHKPIDPEESGRLAKAWRRLQFGLVSLILRAYKRTPPKDQT